MDTIEKVKFPDKKWIKIVKKLFSGKIEDFSELDKLEVDKYVENNNSFSSNINKDKNENIKKDLALDMRLIGLLSNVKEQITKRNIDINELFKQLDKNNNGKLSLKEFKKLFKMLNIEDISENDIHYIIISFDLNNDGKLQYKEFLNLMT